MDLRQQLAKSRFTILLYDKTMIKDPEILYSMVNMKLRDQYESLDDYCYEEDVDREELESILNNAGYYYKEEINQFR